MIYPDPLPFKLRVLRAVTATLKTITPANGYFYDLSDDTDPDALHPTRVFRGRAWFGDNDPIPMLSVLEGVNPADEVAEPQRRVPRAILLGTGCPRECNATTCSDSCCGEDGIPLVDNTQNRCRLGGAPQAQVAGSSARLDWHAPAQ